MQHGLPGHVTLVCQVGNDFQEEHFVWVRGYPFTEKDPSREAVLSLPTQT